MTTSQPPNTNPSRVIPLTCSGHTRPVVHLQFSPITDGTYYLISACKGIFYTEDMFINILIT